MSWYTKKLAKSIWVFHVSASPCNNCDIEILSLLTPKYDVERFGIKLVGSVRHADALLVTGIMNKKVAPRVKYIYEQAPKPVFVIGVGSCPASGIMFRDSYNFPAQEMEEIPFNVYIPGCPPKPEAMLEGIVKLLEALNG
ncbi:MAG: NADH-quinone oxidoreductase subunit NuoB [Candidatus Marinimicrobia bacterium]|nr:NADH-quinone oxidoreductase subunit NuoB [Candidatus Neomarinimicrobiota bacterium]